MLAQQLFSENRMSGNDDVERKAGCWAVMNFTLAKQNEDSMTGKKNISRPLS